MGDRRSEMGGYREQENEKGAPIGAPLGKGIGWGIEDRGTGDRGQGVRGQNGASRPVRRNRRACTLPLTLSSVVYCYRTRLLACDQVLKPHPTICHVLSPIFYLLSPGVLRAPCSPLRALCSGGGREEFLEGGVVVAFEGVELIGVEGELAGLGEGFGGLGEVVLLGVGEGEAN